MLPTLEADLVTMYCLTHERIVKLVREMTEEQLHWRALPESHSIAFHVWHVARWADVERAVIPGMTPQLRRQFGALPEIWERDRYGAQWGFSDEQLGYAQTGMYMESADAVNLPFPDKARLLAYVEASFATAEQTMRAIREEEFSAPEEYQPMVEGLWGESTVGNSIMEHLVHDNRHLGMIECLYGLQTGSGTATV